MATFPVKFFTFSTKYPNSGTRIQLGRSYQFDSPAEAPDQRLFLLRISGMQYFLDASDQIDEVVSQELNMAFLENFYNIHKMAVAFDFNHPVYGTLSCKFNRPLEIPEGLPSGNGVLGAFEVELVEQP